MILYQYRPDIVRADIIKQRVIERDLSLAEAADEIGISKATLSRLEHSGIPDVETLSKVCNWLHKDPAMFFIPKPGTT